jgi:hypothetical protein
MLVKCKNLSPTLKTKQSAYNNIWTKQMRIGLENYYHSNKIMEVKMAKYVVHLDERTNACNLTGRGQDTDRKKQQHLIPK